MSGKSLLLRYLYRCLLLVLLVVGRGTEGYASGLYEVYIISSKPKGRYVRLDSYNPDKAIVSRKHTQLGEISEDTALRYLKELKEKYPEKAKIAKVPSNIDGPNAGIFKYGEDLEGRQILEVPVQTKPIPKRVLDYADKHYLKIRDINGKLYN